jgi:hypothetical protein
MSSLLSMPDALSCYELDRRIMQKLLLEFERSLTVEQLPIDLDSAAVALRGDIAMVKE